MTLMTSDPDCDYCSRTRVMPFLCLARIRVMCLFDSLFLRLDCLLPFQREEDRDSFRLGLSPSIPCAPYTHLHFYRPLYPIDLFPSFLQD